MVPLVHGSTVPWFHGSLLDPFQQFHVLLMLGVLGLDAILQMGPHKVWANGKNPLSCLTGHPFPDAVDLPGCMCMLLNFRLPEPQSPSLLGLCHRQGLKATYRCSKYNVMLAIRRSMRLKCYALRTVLYRLLLAELRFYDQKMWI